MCSTCLAFIISPPALRLRDTLHNPAVFYTPAASVTSCTYTVCLYSDSTSQILNTCCVWRLSQDNSLTSLKMYNELFSFHIVVQKKSTVTCHLHLVSYDLSHTNDWNNSHYNRMKDHLEPHRELMTVWHKWLWSHRDVTWVFRQLDRPASSSQMCMEKDEAPWIRGEITKSSSVWFCLSGVYYDLDKWEHPQIQLAEITRRSVRRWLTERLWIRFTHLANMNLSSRSSYAVLQKIFLHETAPNLVFG